MFLADIIRLLNFQWADARLAGSTLVFPRRGEIRWHCRRGPWIGIEERRIASPAGIDHMDVVEIFVPLPRILSVSHCYSTRYRLAFAADTNWLLDTCASICGSEIIFVIVAQLEYQKSCACSLISWIGNWMSRHLKCRARAGAIALHSDRSFGARRVADANQNNRSIRMI